MSGIRKNRKYMGGLTLFLLLAVSTGGLYGCGRQKGAAEDEKSEVLYLETATGGGAGYRTVKAEYGEFVRISSFDASPYYPVTETVVYEGEAASFGGFLVEQGAEVKKGDAVAKIRVEYDPVTLEEMERNLEKAESDYEWNVKTMEAAADRLQQELESPESTAAAETGERSFWRRRKELELKKARLELELYRLSVQDGLERQRDSLRAFQEQIAEDTIVSPADGVVSELLYLKQGDPVPAGQSLMVIYNPDVVWMKASDPGASLRYSMDVTIETGNAKNRTVMHGRVVSADHLLPDSLRSGYAFVELSDQPERVNWMNTYVKAPLVFEEKALLVDRLAVESDGNGSYVSVLEDGTVHKRQVVKAGQGTEVCWILMGLSEGQEVIAGE